MPLEMESIFCQKWVCHHLETIAYDIFQEEALKRRKRAERFGLSQSEQEDKPDETEAEKEAEKEASMEVDDWGMLQHTIQRTSK